jgi:phosphoglycerate dehydrogenase-like enzyme
MSGGNIPPGRAGAEAVARPFHELPNVLITPHSSSSSDATADRRWSVVAANLDRFARGEKLENMRLASTIARSREPGAVHPNSI